MEGGPLTRDFAVRTRIHEFVFRDTSQMIRGDVANAVAAGLDRMHLDAGEIREDIRHFFQLGPVVLDVLARREVAVALVVLAGDVRQHAQLFG